MTCLSIVMLQCHAKFLNLILQIRRHPFGEINEADTIANHSDGKFHVPCSESKVLCVET